MTTRRQLLMGASAMVAAMGLPLPVRAAGPGDRKFLFVFNSGGWDPTRVFATTFGQRNVDMEPTAQRGTIGGIDFVDHASRPSVRAFFEQHHRRSLVVNGVMVRSIAHEICTMIAMTGTSSGLDPDWPAVLAAADSDRYTLPHLVLGGPSFPGDLGVAVSRAGINGQLESLVKGDVFEMSSEPVAGPTKVTEGILDRYLLRRAEARAMGAGSAAETRLFGDFHASMDKLSRLKDLRFTMNFEAGRGLAEQGRVAADALAAGISRCVTLGYGGPNGQGWDTHANNDTDQSANFEGLFQGLAQIMEILETTDGPGGGTLAEETVVVVLSEMGRTPLLNGFNGKDHWPYTSALLVGPGLTGDRVIGGFDDSYYGETIDPASGEVARKGQILSAEALGATLLALADIDPGPHVSGVDPILGVLS